MGYVTRSELLFRDQRRQRLLRSRHQVGIDFVTAYWRGEEELWELEVRFLPSERHGKRAVPEGVTAQNVEVTLSGAIDPGLRVVGVAYPDDDETGLHVRVQKGAPEEDADPGDLPVYTLVLVGLPQVDRFFARAEFVFHHGGTDPGTAFRFPRIEELPVPPDIDYLARDFESFRQLMLERMARYVPSWKERSPADLGVTIVETLAYAADFLAYYQDAVATEAYLKTARHRVSVRRHARLVGYHLHEGSNARCWVQVKVDWNVPRPAGAPAGFLLPKDTEVLTYGGRLPGCLEKGSSEDLRARERGALVFHTLHDVTLFREHNRLRVYDWDTRAYSLPAGTTRAALRGHHPYLKASDVLLFERRDEGSAEMDPRHRQAVRLSQPPVLTSDPTADEEITEVEWLGEDALREDFPVNQALPGRLKDDLTVVRGNIVLVDHGELRREVLPAVPRRGRYRPRLTQRGLTHAVPFDPEAARLVSADAALKPAPHRAAPAIELYEVAPEEAGGARRRAEAEPSPWERWQPRRDLLGSGLFAQDFVVEMEDDGTARLRFGDGEAGRRPSPGTTFEAVYRIGQGPSGNVGPYAIRHVVLELDTLVRAPQLGFRIIDAKNHLPGTGGTARQSAEEARLFAPEALGSSVSLQRCVTESDFAEVAERHPEVLRAVARYSWSGTWNVARLYVQRQGSRGVDAAFERHLGRHMEPFLMAGWGVEVVPPRYVPLEVHLKVWPEPAVHVESFRRKLLGRFADGAVEFLDPDYFTFGQSVYLSEVIARTMEIPEVGHVQGELFQRWGEESRGELQQGEIPIADLEIAQLENNPSAPQRGILRITVAES